MMDINKLSNHYKIIENEVWLIEEERENMKLYYRVKDFIYSTESNIQRIDIIDTYDFGKCLILDGVIQSTEKDGFIYNEMIAHIPVLAHKIPRKVLVIGGGDCGVVNELIKYNFLTEIEMVEIDELVVKACWQNLKVISGQANDDLRVNYIFDDGVAFIKERKNTYDIIIVDSSDPVGPAVELFSEEFYSDIKEALKEDGVMVCQSQSPMFHQEVFKSSYDILSRLFPITKIYIANIPSYPGGIWSFTLALKEDNFTNLDANLLPKDTKYINEDILELCFKLPNNIKKVL